MHDSAVTAALLARVATGEPLARVELLRLWGPTVLRWCTRLGGPGIDEEDAAHDVFELVIARAHTVRAPEAFATWLFQTTRRVIGHHRRRAWLRRWVPGIVPDVADERAGPSRRAEMSDTARRVQASLDALPATLREVLVLCELEERDGPEVAALLDLPLGTVKSRLRRAREAFEVEARRRGLAPDAEEPG
jgi:RNA polymerase sigma-70 factor (ECF subfamily)